VTSGAADLSHRRVRTARAVAASSFATLVALASHLAGGGGAPALLLVATVCALSSLPAVLLIGRRLSLIRQALVIGLAECALHLIFSLGAATSAGPVPRLAVPVAPMPGMPVAAAPMTAMPMTAMPVPGPGMWAAHTVAALLTVVAWNRGEHAFWALVRFARRLRRAAVPELPHDGAWPERSRSPILADALPSSHLERVLDALARRGPPRSLPQR
jgi:hypothetical protein